ncbi:THAP domain-containing protein 1-like isoform X2 [Ischnura elegans]|uniref:THAP domain-containing protein 1-like isoform X2 n=1 Tax=Ischnura elegans TaxID=197161 RepID=UPI001ED86C70|nr:THAP domain-containing protein 1-like isoform X2 [Ischnura elegans]
MVSWKKGSRRHVLLGAPASLSQRRNMVHSCCAQGCKERFVKGSGISFHGFPSDGELKKKWVIALKRDKFVPTVYTRICSKHFTPESFVAERFGNRWLKTDAVPSIFGFCQKAKKSTPREPTETSSEVSEPVTSTVLQGECLGSARPDRTVNDDPSKDSPQPGCSGERKRPLRYIGDFSEVEMSSPTAAKKFLSLAMEHIEVQRRKIKYLQTKETRLKKRVRFLESILRQVKEKSSQKDDTCSTLKLHIIGSKPLETLVESVETFCGKSTQRGKGRRNKGVGKVNGQKQTLEAHQQHQITQCQLRDNLVSPLDLTMCQSNSSSQ